MTPSVWYFLGTVIVLCILGGCIGALFSGKVSGAAWGMLIGTMTGMYWSVHGVIKSLFPERYYAYSNEVSVSEDSGGDIIINIPELGESRRIKKSISNEQWFALAEKVHETGTFDRNIFKAVFDNEGSTIYSLIKEPLVTAGVLVNYGNGAKVTDHIGYHFFKQLARGEYNILKVLPHPPQNEEVS